LFFLLIFFATKTLSRKVLLFFCFYFLFLLSVLVPWRQIPCLCFTSWFFARSPTGLPDACDLSFAGLCSSAYELKIRSCDSVLPYSYDDFARSVSYSKQHTIAPLGDCSPKVENDPPQAYAGLIPCHNKITCRNYTRPAHKRKVPPLPFLLYYWVSYRTSIYPQVQATKLSIVGCTNKGGF
jgi:hypothetical protein